jgi:hypothetical protein
MGEVLLTISVTRRNLEGAATVARVMREVVRSNRTVSRYSFFAFSVSRCWREGVVLYSSVKSCLAREFHIKVSIREGMQKS